MMKTKHLVIFLAVLLLTFLSASADSHLPQGILKAEEYNKNLAQDFLQKVSFFVAFLAGLTSVFSPCILPLLPAYFAVTFKEKRRITLATFVFFLGFTAVFIIMALLATLTGEALISAFRGVNFLVPLAGLFMITSGIMIFLGIGFSGLLVKKNFKGDSIGVFFSGAAFAIGWTACIGPVLSGMLLMASTFGNYATASYLMFAYSLGIFVPLFILSFFYDKLRLSGLKWMYKGVRFKIRGNEFHTNTPNIIAGLLFVMIGAVFLVFRGTWVVNGMRMFGLRAYFYSWQNIFLENAQAFNLAGFVIFSLFVSALLYFLVKEVRSRY